jgi:two-component system, chemotaxis family, sensor kinase Cph1
MDDVTVDEKPDELDLCALEPIRIPGGIQPHGALVVLDAASLAMRQASSNLLSRTGMAFKLGDSTWQTQAGGVALHRELSEWLRDTEQTFLRTLVVHGRGIQVSAHRTEQGILVEFEEPPAREADTLEALYPRLRAFVDAIAGAFEVQDLADAAVMEFSALTGFNRVMLYSFDAEGTGTVLAEHSDGELPSYLGLRFPASDIPAQARELYRMNRLRLIPDANYTPVAIEPVSSPVDGKPLDLSCAALRSVSPVHLQYMRNMGTLSSMSISILVDGKLWGLISCHNAQPRIVNAQVRTACDFLGQILSLQIAARERSAETAKRMALKQIEVGLVARMSRTPAFQDALVENGQAWLQMVASQGAALVTPDSLVTHGLTPSRPELLELARWLSQRGVTEVFATESLAAHWPQAESFAGPASGLLAISISQIHASYIMWFREEVVRTVKWAGEPSKPALRSPERLHPRQSFELWKQQVRMQSLPWDSAEIESARDFRHSIIAFVLRHAEERAALSEQLLASNRELEAFTYSISHDLRAPFRHITGYAALLKDHLGEMPEKPGHYLRSIVEAARSAGQLVDDLLNFSQLGRTSINPLRVDVAKMVREIRGSMAPDLEGRHIEWHIGELPPAFADGAMLRQVFINLMDNATKYTAARDPAVITIRGHVQDGQVHYSVADNGVGFEMAYVGKLFGVFRRLHRTEDFPGTGIGLALVKRIVDRHGGTVSAEGIPGEGATFRFSLPQEKEE